MELRPKDTRALSKSYHSTERREMAPTDYDKCIGRGRGRALPFVVPGALEHRQSLPDDLLPAVVRENRDCESERSPPRSPPSRGGLS